MIRCSSQVPELQSLAIAKTMSKKCMDSLPSKEAEAKRHQHLGEKSAECHISDQEWDHEGTTDVRPERKLLDIRNEKSLWRET